MEEEKSEVREAPMAFEGPSAGVEETPFDRLESRIDILIAKYEKLRGEHSSCGERLTAKEARIRELKAQLENLEKQRSEIRNRLDALIHKLSRFS